MLGPLLNNILVKSRFFPRESFTSTAHIVIVETTVSDERGMNHVAMTIFDIQKENVGAGHSNQQTPDLKSCALTTPPAGSTFPNHSGYSTVSVDISQEY